MAVYHIINGGVITIGSSTIMPTEGHPSGQKYIHNNDYVRTFTSLDDPIMLGKDFGYEHVDVTRSNILEDGSFYITESGVVQNIFLKKSGRNYLYFGNLSVNNMYLGFGDDVTIENSYLIPSSGNIEFSTGFVPLESVEVICDYSGAGFVAKQT